LVITGEFPRKCHMMIMMEFFLWFDYPSWVWISYAWSGLFGMLSCLIDLNRIHLLIDIYWEMCKVLKEQCVRVWVWLIPLIRDLLDNSFACVHIYCVHVYCPRTMCSCLLSENNSFACQISATTHCLIPLIFSWDTYNYTHEALWPWR
jgi:hypothetical protein